MNVLPSSPFLGAILISLSAAACTDAVGGQDNSVAGATTTDAAGGTAPANGGATQGGGVSGGSTSTPVGPSAGGAATSVATTGGAPAGGAAVGGSSANSNSAKASSGGSSSTITAAGGNVGTGGSTASSTGGTSNATNIATGGIVNASGGNATTSSATEQPYKGISNSTCEERTALNVSWYYNWTTKPNPSCAAGGEFIPMVSGKNEKTMAQVASAISSIANAGYDTVLGFNEPNKSSQSNMTVDEVLALWPAMVGNEALRVGSPVTSADAKSWFTDFMTRATAQNLRVDFIAIHWYGWNSGSCDNANELENYIKWAEGFGKPLWLTEWGCMNVSNPSPEVVAAFYPQAIAMFQKHPAIERYAWYRWNTNNETFDSAGALTALGASYAAAPAYR